MTPEFGEHDNVIGRGVLAGANLKYVEHCITNTLKKYPRKNKIAQQNKRKIELFTTGVDRNSSGQQFRIPKLRKDFRRATVACIEIGRAVRAGSRPVFPETIAKNFDEIRFLVAYINGI